MVLNCVDPETEARMKAEVDHALRTGDSVGGVFEVVAHGVPPGLGTYANWDERLDGLLAWSVMSPAGGEGGGDRARRYGGAVLRLGRARFDSLCGGRGQRPPGRHTRFAREQNNAGGIEGGVSNGEDIVVRGYLKPISTLRRPLESVTYETREATKAAYERSDVCVVPAAGVAAEAMVAFVLAQLALEKFGGDSATELKRNFDGYLEQIRNY